MSSMGIVKNNSNFIRHHYQKRLPKLYSISKSGIRFRMLNIDFQGPFGKFKYGVHIKCYIKLFLPEGLLIQTKIRIFHEFYQNSNCTAKRLLLEIEDLLKQHNYKHPMLKVYRVYPLLNHGQIGSPERGLRCGKLIIYF